MRVITANQRSDHATIARFRVRHQDALAGLFGDVLALCARAGVVSVGTIAVDGTKIHANASRTQNRGYRELAREMLDEADEVDAAEDARFGDRRGDELPPSWAASSHVASGCASSSASSMASASSAPPSGHRPGKRVSPRRTAGSKRTGGPRSGSMASGSSGLSARRSAAPARAAG